MIMRNKETKMKTKVKVFRWNTSKNKSEIIVTWFNGSKKVNGADIERKMMKKEKGII